jgi:hypothetical protein
VVRRRVAGRGGRRIAFGANAYRVNRLRHPNLTAVKTFNQVLGAGASSIINGAVNAGSYAVRIMFDPSGINSSITVNLLLPGGSESVLFTGTVPAMPDWASYLNLYSQFKLVKARLIWKAIDTGVSGLASNPPIMNSRYCYDQEIVLGGSTPGIIPGIATYMQQANNVKVSTFTVEKMIVSDVVYPRVLAQVAQDGLKVMKPGFCLVNSASTLGTGIPSQYGYVCYFPYIPVSTSMELDIEWTVIFKDLF